MAVIAEEMKFDAVDATPPATVRVTFALNSHTCQFNPLENDNNELNTFAPAIFLVDFRLTEWTADPVAAPTFHMDHLTLRT